MPYLDYLKKAKTVKESVHYTLYDICNSEFAKAKNIDNTPPLQIINNANLIIKHILEQLTTHYKIRPDIHSMFRCSKVNKAVGGVDSSQHCTGQAVDFTIVGIPNIAIIEWIRHNLDFDQLILESTWVHCSYTNGKNRKQVLRCINGRYISI